MRRGWKGCVRRETEENVHRDKLPFKGLLVFDFYLMKVKTHAALAGFSPHSSQMMISQVMIQLKDAAFEHASVVQHCGRS